jgi:hypothetical protein
VSNVTCVSGLLILDCPFGFLKRLFDTLKCHRIENLVNTGTFLI